jgi:hypothetical protein
MLLLRRVGLRKREGSKEAKKVKKVLYFYSIL